MNDRLLGKYTGPRGLLVFSLVLLLICSLPLSAQNAGYDLLETTAGAKVDLSQFGLGVVPLRGVAIGPCTGSTDTIMHRLIDTPGGGTTPVEVTALFMRSAGSITINGQQVDLYVTINNSGGVISSNVLPQPDALAPSTGTVTIDGGGTFDSDVTVNADLIAVPAGTSVGNPGNWVAHKAAPGINLTSTGSPWKSTPPPGTPMCQPFPHGGFFPSPQHTGPHPVTPAKCDPVVIDPDAVPIDPKAVAEAKAAKKSQGPTANAVAIARCVSAQ